MPGQIAYFSIVTLAFPNFIFILIPFYNDGNIFQNSILTLEIREQQGEERLFLFIYTATHGIEITVGAKPLTRFFPFSLNPRAVLSSEALMGPSRDLS
jgi:hypothetical protein